MDSLLRDLNREQSKMKTDVNNLFRHYNQLQDYVHQYIQQTTTEWAKLVLNHPQAVLLIMETTHVVNEHGGTYGESEPIRFTTLSIASNEMYDQLLRPTYSHDVRGTEYHGLTMDDLKDKPTISEAWDDIAATLEGRHLIVFGVDWAHQALMTVQKHHTLDGAYCLHNKCKEYYNEFYELSLEKVLSYQSIDKRRDELKDSRARILMLHQVINNLAIGMEKPEQETTDDSLNDLDDLDDHPF